MQFDIVLPAVISLITIITIYLYPRLEVKVKSLFEEKEFRTRDAVFLVIAMGVMVTIIVFVPEQALQALFLAAYSFVLFLFTYIVLERWYIAVLPPLLFLALYFSPLWNVVLIDAFAAFFAISISLYLGGLFSWTTVLVFTVLITVMDLIQVFGTGFMGAAAGKILELELPVLILVYTYPVESRIGLGLGDVFLTGLLSIHTVRKFGRKAGIIAALSIGAAFFVYEAIVFNLSFFVFFPATIIVVCGWLLGLALHRFAVKSRPSQPL